MNNTLSPQHNLEHLLSELRRVTTMIAQRVQQMRALNPNEEDEFRGLYISEEEVDQLLADPELFLTGTHSSALAEVNTSQTMAGRLSNLQIAFGLNAFELDVILITLAPELDLRYEKLFAYLQDDVTRRRPSVDLVLRLLCPGLAGQLAARPCFDAEAPLLRYRLLEFGEEKTSPPLLARTIRLDEGIIAYLLGENRLDARLRSLAEFAPPPFGRLISSVEEHVARLVMMASETAATTETIGSADFVIILHGLDEISKRNLASEVCRHLNLPLLIANCAWLPGLPRAESLLKLLEREAQLRHAPIYWANFEALLREEAVAQEANRLVTRLLKEQKRLSFVATSQPLAPLIGGQERCEFQIRLEMPGYSERQQLWERELGAAVAGLDLESLSSRFRLSSGQIVAAMATARHSAAWRGETVPTLADLEEACRRHSSQRLSSLARKIASNYRWNDIVLPADQFRMLHEICEQVKQRAFVYEKWGFERKLSLGKGLNVIFAGASGTGKTMSAEIIAGELRMDLYKIDLSNVVSKYIGETEKNLERIFTEAGESNAILFFDEADSIFGKRSEVKDAHDRYANIETGYLLQKMEEYDGIVILATNLRKNLDDAFVRRMHFIIEYPFPDEADRLEIWRRVFPQQVPLSANVDLNFMARQFKIAGGNIKNIGLAAAFLAAGDNQAGTPQVEMQHLIRATRREFLKMGKLCTPTDFGRYFSLLNDDALKPASFNSAK